MAIVHIPMNVVEYCLICHEYIGRGNIPAICDKESCKVLFEYEISFNRWAKEQTINKED